MLHMGFAIADPSEGLGRVRIWRMQAHLGWEAASHVPLAEVDTGLDVGGLHLLRQGAEGRQTRLVAGRRDNHFDLTWLGRGRDEVR